jgi:hypothetical protein
MHCADEGCTKHFLKLWFSTKHHGLAFYLQHRIHTIDSILKKVKYPKEINRSYNPITQAISHYHANEFRALATYSLIYIMQGQFTNQRYYYNLVMYLLFLRLVRQDFVSETDNSMAQILIDECLKEFPSLYGTKNMTHNLHSDLHLPDQVKNHGSLCDAYPGENCFRELKKCVHGTVHIAKQMAKHISIENEINKFFTIEEVNKIGDYRLKNLYHKLQKYKNQNHQYSHTTNAILLESKQILLTDLLPFEYALLSQTFEATALRMSILKQSYKVFVEKKCNT